MTLKAQLNLIGPHEGRELALMLAGKKSLALFYAPLSERHVIPEADFEAHVREGTIVKVEKTIRHRHETDDRSPIVAVLYALPGERWRMDTALAIIEPVWQGTRPPSPEDDIAIGRLLGYPEEAITQFIELREGFGTDSKSN